MRTEFFCPSCKKGFKFSVEDEELKGGVTTDCNNCGLLILVENGKAYDFHKKLHEECPQWPEDGKGTGSVTIVGP